MLLSVSGFLLSAWFGVVVAPTARPTPSASPTPTGHVVQSGILAIPASWRNQNWHAHSGDDHFTRLGAWTSADGHESIVVDDTPMFDANLQRIAQSVADGMKTTSRAMVLREASTVRLCRGQQGWKQVYAASAGNGMTYVFAATRTRVYVATYLAQSGASPEGEAAAESLCPPTDPIVHLPPAPVQAPSGWTAVSDVATGPLPAGLTYWAWIPSGSQRAQRFVAMKFPMPPGHAGLSYGLSTMVARFTNGHATVVERNPIELCHSTDAVYVVMEYASRMGPVFLESVMTIAGKRAYAVVYTRGASDHARPEAERALRSLCPT